MAECASKAISAHTCPRLQRMQAWAFPQSVGEPDRWELTCISGSGLLVSKGWQLAQSNFVSDWGQSLLLLTTIEIVSKNRKRFTEL